MRKEAQSYLAMVKAAEMVPCGGSLEKRAMWSAFNDELQKIAEYDAMQDMAQSFAEKRAGAISETIGGVGGAVAVEKILNHIHPDISHGPHLLALTGGAVAGSMLANKLTRKHPEAPREGTPGSQSYTMGKEDHSGMGLVAASLYLQRQQSGWSKTAKAKKEKDDPYTRTGDTLWDKHKGKIIAGLATATAVGVGAKLLHRRHKFGKAHKIPTSAKPAASAHSAPAPAVPPPAPSNPPASAAVPKTHTVAGREVPAWATPKTQKKPRVADAEAKMDPRKKWRRERHEDRRKSPRREMTDEEHDAMEGY